MLDVDEVLESGVFLIVYADDIFLYVIGNNEDLDHRKLPATLGRIHNWCQWNCLTIEAAKCSAISFTRRREPRDPLKLLETDISWSPIVKILDVWFFHTFYFTPHIKNIKLEAQRRLNYQNCYQPLTGHHYLAYAKAH